MHEEKDAACSVSTGEAPSPAPAQLRAASVRLRGRLSPETGDICVCVEGVSHLMRRVRPKTSPASEKVFRFAIIRRIQPKNPEMQYLMGTLFVVLQSDATRLYWFHWSGSTGPTKFRQSGCGLVALVRCSPLAGPVVLLQSSCTGPAVLVRLCQQCIRLQGTILFETAWN